MAFRSHFLRWLSLSVFLSLLVVVRTTKVAGMPTPTASQPDRDGSSLSLNDTDLEVLDRIFFLSTSPLTGNDSVCSSAYSCEGTCSGEQSVARKHENISAVVIQNTVDHLCFCDSRCKQFADCCHDYDDFCFSNGSSKLHHAHRTTERVHYSASAHEEEDGVPYTVEEEIFRCIKIEQYPSSAFWAKTVCPSEWTNDYVSDLCMNPSKEDMLTQLPVIDAEKTVYQNAFCAECNAVWEYKFMLLDSVCKIAIPSNIINHNQLFSAYLTHNCVTYVRSGLSEPPRACLKTINTCPKSYYRTETMDKLDQACDRSTQFPVLDFNNSEEPTIYKNPECALCNGVTRRNHRCFKESPKASDEALGDAVNDRGVIEHDDIYGKLFIDREDGIEAAEELNHVITNYNSDMTRTVILEEEDKYVVPIIHECPYGAVFDPFQAQCRQIHCETGYVLEGNECVLSIDKTGVANHVSDLVSDAMDGKNGTPMSNRFKLIITVNVSTDLNPAFEFIRNNSLLKRFVQFLNVSGVEIRQDLENSTFAFVPSYPRYLNNTQIDMSFNASGDGQVFIIVTYTPHFETFDWQSNKNALLEFYENFEQDTSLVFAADCDVYVDDEEIDTGDLDIKSIIETTTRHFEKLYHVINDCDTGTFVIHPSSEIVFANGSDPHCPVISITHETRWYDCNDTIYFKYDPEVNEEEQEFYVFVCSDVYALPPDCPRLVYNTSEFVVLPNGTAVVDSGLTYEYDEYELDDGNLVVCSNFSSQIEEIYVIFFGFTSAQIYMLFVLGILSDICLLLTIITYLIFRELRTLPGLNLIGLMVANVCFNCSLLIGGTATIGSDLCVAGAIMIHYYTLANLCWMTSIAFDAFLTFGGSRRQVFMRFQATCPRKKRHIMYSAFAWGIPGIVVGMGTLFNFCECGPFPVWYGRYISCWVNDPLGFLYLFTIPTSIILLSNYVLFILAIRGIKTAKIKTSRYNSSNAKRDLLVYVKLLTTTGFGWVVGYIAAFSEATFLWSCFLILLSLQGVFIFLAFFCSNRVLTLYVGLFKGRRGEQLTRGATTSSLGSHRASAGSSSSSSGGCKRPVSISGEIESVSSSASLGIDTGAFLERIPKTEKISECSDDGIEFDFPAGEEDGGRTEGDCDVGSEGGKEEQAGVSRGSVDDQTLSAADSDRLVVQAGGGVTVSGVDNHCVTDVNKDPDEFEDVFL